MTGSPTRIFLVRHGETIAARDEECRGRTDIPLSRRGQHESEDLATSFAALKVIAIYSSPSARAITTARLIAAAAARDVVAIAELAEIDFGSFDGLTFGEIEAADPDLYERWMASPTSVRFPGGETFGEMKARVRAGVDTIRQRHLGETSVAVTHAGPIRAILGDVLGISDHAVFRFDIRPASVTLIEWNGEQPLVRGVNLKMHGDVRTPA